MVRIICYYAIGVLSPNVPPVTSAADHAQRHRQVYLVARRWRVRDSRAKLSDDDESGYLKRVSSSFHVSEPEDTGLFYDIDTVKRSISTLSKRQVRRQLLGTTQGTSLPPGLLALCRRVGRGVRSCASAHTRARPQRDTGAKFLCDELGC